MEIDKLKQATSDEDPKKGSAAKKGAVASRAPSGKPGYESL